MTPIVHATKEQWNRNREYHFFKRIKERYGLTMSADDVRKMTDMVRTVHDNVDLVDDTEFPNNRYKMIYLGLEFVVVYNVIDESLVTALPWRNEEPPKHKRMTQKYYGRLFGVGKSKGNHVKAKMFRHRKSEAEMAEAKEWDECEDC